MSRSDNPCLSLAIARLTYGQIKTSPLQAEHFAIWVLKAPYPGGYVHHDSVWSESVSQTWVAWEQMFSLRGLPYVPLVHHASQRPLTLPPDTPSFPIAGQVTNYTARLMQDLGINIWQWLFDGPIQNTLAQSQGIAIGQGKPLRLRLEIRDPDLIALPWEIMQPQAGKQAISLSQQILFSRTSSDVDPLPPQHLAQYLKILLVLGQDTEGDGRKNTSLELEKEAAVLANVMENPERLELANYNPDRIESDRGRSVQCRVDTLVQPTPAELIQRLEAGRYNIIFYAGHGVPGPDGGLLFLRPDASMNGTELAQVLVRCQVTLAVFNACWGAQPYHDKKREGEAAGLTLPRSSLAEVLIHHGVPAVLGMRDSIADREALSFIQAFAQALGERRPIDQAVAVARQQLLTLYKFNQPAWTLPVLYMHPEFNGELIKPIEDSITELPGLSHPGNAGPNAYLRSLGTTAKICPICGGLMRVGRLPENDLVIPEQWVSQKHAEIICRNSLKDNRVESIYFLRDFSRFGTFILCPNGWQKVHHQEVELPSGVQLKFGSTQGQTWEFFIEPLNN